MEQVLVSIYYEPTHKNSAAVESVLCNILPFCHLCGPSVLLVVLGQSELLLHNIQHHAGDGCYYLEKFDRFYLLLTHASAV